MYASAGPLELETAGGGLIQYAATNTFRALANLGLGEAAALVTAAGIAINSTIVRDASCSSRGCCTDVRG